MKKGILLLFLGAISVSAAHEINQPENTLYRIYCGKKVSVNNVIISIEGVSPLAVRQEFYRDGAIEVVECKAPKRYHFNKYALVGTYRSGKHLVLILDWYDYLNRD